MDSNTTEKTAASVNTEKTESQKKTQLPPHKEYAKRMLSFSEKYIMTLYLLNLEQIKFQIG